MADQVDTQELALIDSLLSAERCQLCIELGLNPYSNGKSIKKDEHILLHLNAEHSCLENVRDSSLEKVAALCFPESTFFSVSPNLPSTSDAPDMTEKIEGKVSSGRKRQTTIEEFAIQSKKAKTQPDLPDSPETLLLSIETSSVASSSPPAVSKPKRPKTELKCVRCQSIGRNARFHLFTQHIKRNVVQCPYCKFGSLYKRTVVRDHVAKEHPQKEQRIVDKRKEDYIQAAYRDFWSESFPEKKEDEIICLDDDDVADSQSQIPELERNEAKELFCQECKEFHPEPARQHIFQSHIKALTVLCGYCEFGAYFDPTPVKRHMQREHKVGLKLRDKRGEFVIQIQKWSHRCYKTPIEEIEKQELEDNMETIRSMMGDDEKKVRTQKARKSLPNRKPPLSAPVCPIPESLLRRSTRNSESRVSYTCEESSFDSSTSDQSQ